MLKNSAFTKRNQWIALLLIGIAALVGVTSILTYASTASSNPDFVTDTITESTAPKTSHRLIVQLESPALAELPSETMSTMSAGNGRLEVNSTAAQAYVSQLQAEQNAFVNTMQNALPEAAVSTYINEAGQAVEATYQVVFNGMAVDPGSTSREEARRTLEALPGVKAVYLDFAHEPTLYASLPLINAPAIWTEAGGQGNAGDGIKFASMDGGLHHAAPMFDGTGWSYPGGWPAGGLGDSANNNGKIIASRAYFRSWDPPSVGDENTWPGTQGTSHGTHTGSTSVGISVTADYLGVNENISGVAPGAWAMSYRVFYNSVTNDGSFYNVEGIAALEDIVLDGADVVNNSWGGGPGSVGGEFDPLDTALINAYNAGVFVSMSAGNAGPGPGTGDHPSAEYINVAASTTSGTFASGRLNVVLPTPISPTLQNISYSGASFGPSLPIGTVISYTFVTAESVDPANFEGCDPWPAGTFTGKAALISRGACEFGVKVVNAENGGADFVVVYNHADGGDELINMGAGAVGDQATIPSIFVGNTAGTGMVDWYDANGAPSTLAVDTQAFQAGNDPDQIISFSSRGPSAAMTLKPDIAAPGVNILAQGYAQGVTGEARHLGYGQASGTSMASPHVAGAAAIIKQLQPGWSNAEIKSAMMSTSKFMEVYNYDGSPAQPLDMGAGRLDLTNVTDPGVILDPPSLSFGLIDYDGMKTIPVSVTNITTATETYTVSTLFTGNGFAITQTTPLTGFVVSSASLALNAGETKTISVTFDAATSQGVGDNQGYILLEGDNGHEAHMPAWARVTPEPEGNDVLIIQNDGNFTFGHPNYLSYYTDALDDSSISYDVYNADMHYGMAQSLPDMAELAQYDVILYFTGDNYEPDGTYTVATPLTAIDMDILNEYANNGGIIIAMGQDLSGVLASDATDDGTFFYASTLGGNWLQDSVTAYGLPSLPIVPAAAAPAAMQGVRLDLSGPETYVGVNEMPDMAPDLGHTLYLPVVMNAGTPPNLPAPPTGTATYTFDLDSNRLDYSIVISVTEAQTVTAAHIHEGSFGETGPVLYPLLTAPSYVTDTLTIAGSLLIANADVPALLSGGTYVNVHTAAMPSGAVRAQIDIAPSTSGASNQYYIDELQTMPNSEPESTKKAYAYNALLTYPGPYNIENGTVAMAHREQPNLEYPGVSYNGRSIYTSFGLEGVNNIAGYTAPDELLSTFMDWAMDEPTAVISDITSTYSNTTSLTFVEATVSSNITGTTGVAYRWDFGDGSPYAGPFQSAVASHAYAACGTYDVRVEAWDSWGNAVVTEKEITVVNCP
jgi:subtilisin family serine protease